MPQHDPAHPPARWDLPENPSLEWLRRRAKQLRDGHAAGLELAVDLVTTYDPGDGAVSLSRAQRVLARAFGFAGWLALRERLATVEELSRPMEPEDDRDGAVDRFLRLACMSYTEPPAVDRARSLLDGDPSLATASASTLAACGRADDLAALLAGDPDAAVREDGPHRWPPLLHLCYARLGLGDPVATMRVLLDAGADPDSGFLWKGFPSPFTALTGVLGGGERDEPPHPDGVALAEMLLAAGADPNDNQAFYNRMFRPDDSHLGPLLAHGAGRPHPSPWRDRLGDAYPTPEEMVGEHLRSAAEKGFIGRVRLLLAHGVDPHTTGYHPVLGDQNAYEVAVRGGHLEVADLLAAAGAGSDRLDDIDLLLAAAFAGDAAAADRLRGEGLPERRPDAMRLAGELHGPTAIRMLVELGYDVSARGSQQVTALHETALRGDVETCRWLVARGADRSAEDGLHGSTPSGWAAHAGHTELAEEIAP